MENIKKYSNLFYFLEDLAYLPPELFSNVWHKNKIDQYILGLLAYELLAGKMPVTIKKLDVVKFQKNPIQIFEDIRKSLEKEGARAFKANLETIDIDNCPDSFRKAILKMISREPDSRFDSLEEALDTIDRDYELIVAKESFGRCLQKKDFFYYFYKNFRERLNSEIPGKFDAMFERIDKGKKYPEHSNDPESTWNRHYDMLKEAILLLFAFYDQENRGEFNILSRITEYYAGISRQKDSQFFHIHGDDFSVFMDTLIETICGGNDETEKSPFDEKCQSVNEREIIRFCWEKVLKEGIEYMKAYIEHNHKKIS
ncbi:MAG: hypothetical protein F6K36_14555 [Symploca sp. SIO3C6]|nr:hypothetical protein [Symploca sp. SIO3C6]